MIEVHDVVRVEAMAIHTGSRPLKCTNVIKLFLLCLPIPLQVLTLIGPVVLSSGFTISWVEWILVSHSLILPQGDQESNPDQVFWRHLCYHYTITLRT